MKAFGRFTLNWIQFWEGALIAYFFGLWWALVFFGAWSLVAIGFHLSKWDRLKERYEAGQP